MAVTSRSEWNPQVRKLRHRRLIVSRPETLVSGEEVLEGVFLFGGRDEDEFVADL